MYIVFMITVPRARQVERTRRKSALPRIPTTVRGYRFPCSRGWRASARDLFTTAAMQTQISNRNIAALNRCDRANTLNSISLSLSLWFSLVFVLSFGAEMRAHLFDIFCFGGKPGVSCPLCFVKTSYHIHLCVRVSVCVPETTSRADSPPLACSYL